MRDFLDDTPALAWGRVAVRPLRAAGPGAPALLDVETEAGFGPALHAHRDAPATLVVTEGEMEVWVDGRLGRYHAGQSVAVPAGAAHAWRAAGRGPSRHLMVGGAAGFADFLAALAGPHRVPEFEAARRHGIEFRGPALGAY